MAIMFSDWDRRPAVLLEPSFTAFAVLAPGEDWTEIDSADVFHTAGVMSEPAWRAKFERRFGPLDVSKFGQ